MSPDSLSHSNQPFQSNNEWVRISHYSNILLLFNFHKIILFYFNWNWIALLHSSYSDLDVWLEFWVLSGLTECLRKRRQTFSTYLSFRISCLAFNVQSPLPRLALNSVQDFWLLSADSLSLSHTTTCHFSPTMNGYALPINQLFLLLFNFHKIILLCFNWKSETELLCFIFWFRLT